MTIFNISVVSDTVCPWCYVGKKQLERGIAAYRASNAQTTMDSFNITWHPFYLNPNAPKEGMDKRQMYESKFGPEKTRMIQERLSSVGKAMGIDFKYGGRTGNTRNSHRLIHLAGKKGEETQSKLVNALFSGYFEKEQDITNLDVLKKAGLNAGLGAAELDAWLYSDEGGSAVDEEVASANSQIITGVPNFTISSSHDSQQAFEIRGAQDAEGFKQVFEKIKSMESR